MRGARSARLDWPAARGWWRRQGRRFLAASLVAAAAVVAVGWTTGLREAMHGALLAVAVFALLPLMLFAGVLLVMILARAAIDGHVRETGSLSSIRALRCPDR